MGLGFNKPILVDKDNGNTAKVNDNGQMLTAQDGNVPAEYSKQTSSGNSFLVQKGQVTNLRLRPQIINEQAESSRKIQGTITPTNIVGQFIKNSQDNFNGLGIALESAAGVSIDNFESYEDDLAIQAEWVATSVVEDEWADVETSVVFEGNQAMYLPTDLGSLANEWEITIDPFDYTGYTGQFYVYSNKEWKDVKMRVFVKDSLGNSSSAQIVQANKDLWTKIIVKQEQLTQDGGTPTDFTDITRIGYRVEGEKKDGFMIVDILIAIPPGGEIEAKLWNMGDTLPITGVTALNTGTQYTKLGDLGITGKQEASVKIQLTGGKKTYHINDFVAGAALEMPGNELLVKDNYYAITLHYVDANVSVYGPDDTFQDAPYYTNGYGFTTPDVATAITALANNADIKFIMFSTQDVFVNEVKQAINALPGGEATTTIYTEDSKMNRIDVLVAGVNAIQFVSTPLHPKYFMEKGAKLEQEYNDAFVDNVSLINLLFQYRFIPPTVNG